MQGLLVVAWPDVDLVGQTAESCRPSGSPERHPYVQHACALTKLSAPVCDVMLANSSAAVVRSSLSRPCGCRAPHQAVSCLVQ